MSPLSQSISLTAILIWSGVALAEEEPVHAPHCLSGGGRIEAFVEMNYYTSEPTADVVFEFGCVRLSEEQSIKAVLDPTA